MTSELFNPVEAARFLGLSVRTLALWRKKNRGPAFIRLGRRGQIRYLRSDLANFLAQNRSEPGTVQAEEGPLGSCLDSIKAGSQTAGVS